MTVSLRSLLVLAPVAVAIAACGSAPEPQTESTEAPLSVGGIVPQPRPRPPLCWDVYTPNAGCSIYALDGATNPTQQLLGCGPIYGYHNGANAGILGGTGSFCPDTPSNRAYLHDHNFTGFGGGYDDSCIVVPCGQIFVFWSYFMGPNCPSSCHTVSGPPPI
jgi:hypothetical protein